MRRQITKEDGKWYWMINIGNKTLKSEITTLHLEEVKNSFLALKKINFILRFEEYTCSSSA